jgi:hypothetical protein
MKILFFLTKWGLFYCPAQPWRRRILPFVASAQKGHIAQSVRATAL